MEIPTLEQDTQRIFRVIGQFDAMAVEMLRSVFSEIGESEQRDVQLDLSGVDFIDSSGIGAMVFMYKRLTARNKKLTITGLHDQPLDLIRALRIDKTIPIETGNDAKEFAAVS